jgi:CO/xanthine dehydrogenase FAD-binding subunit
MLLGDVLRDLQDETLAMGALAAMNDLVLLTRVRNAAGLLAETPGEYAANSVRGFADRAGDEDWQALVTAIQNSADTGQTCLAHMIDWALKRDAAPQTHPGCACEGHAD